MKLLSWNVNGFRAAVAKGFYDFVAREQPDVLCLQEIKMAETPHFPIGWNYKVLWNPAKKAGYSGTAVLTKEPVLSFVHGLDGDEEGRVTTAEFADFYLVNAYFPNSQRELARLDFKLDFNKAMLKHLERLRKRKPVAICGDFNVAHTEQDIARPKDNEKNAGFTREERNWFSSLLAAGYVDTFRARHPDEVAYTWWTYRFAAREKNIGWRIDYFVTSKDLEFDQAFILDTPGSDHVPVGLTL